MSEMVSMADMEENDPPCLIPEMPGMWKPNQFSQKEE